MEEENSMSLGLLTKLKAVVNEKLSGVVFIASSDNRSAQISVLEGGMVFALCQGKKGGEAIKLIAQMPQIRFRFQEGAVPPTRADMPSAEEIFRWLDIPQNSGGFNKPVDRTMPPSPGIKVNSSVSGKGITSEQKITVQEILAECIGPMAKIICEDHLDSVSTLQEGIEAIAADIPKEQAVRFKSNVLRMLG